MKEREYGEFFGNRVFTNDEIKKLQEEKNGNEKSKKRGQNENIRIKESDYGKIKEKLNEIYRKYYERLSKGKIVDLEEFYDMIMISFVFYEQFERISMSRKDENGEKIIKFRNSIRKYSRLKSERSKYSNYNKKYTADEEIKRNRLEIKRIDIEIDEIRKEITGFTNIFLSELWKDYEKFKEFIERGENIKTLAQLTELNRSFESLDEINIFENYSEIRNKLENYMKDFEQTDFKINENESARNNIENIINTLDKGNDIINVLMNFSYANILMRNNIMKFPLISEEYRENSDITEKIKALKFDMLNYYRDSLTYRNGIKIDDEIIESHSDVLFYDLLYLEYYRENTDTGNTVTAKEISEERNFAGKNIDTTENTGNESFRKNSGKGFRTFENLESSKKNYKTDSENEINLKDKNEPEEKSNNDKISGIKIDRGNVTINCTIDDFIQISNALEMIGKLKGEDVQKNILAFLDKDDEYYEDKKFKPKSEFMSERVNILKRMETVTEIERKLSEKGMKLISSERRLIFGLLEKTENETETFKAVMLKMLENPLFVRKVAKNGSVGKNQVYEDFYRDISYIEKMNRDIRKSRINGLSDKKGSLKQLDSLYNFDFEALRAEKINPEIMEKLKKYQKDYRKIAGGEDYETL